MGVFSRASGQQIIPDIEDAQDGVDVFLVDGKRLWPFLDGFQDFFVGGFNVKGVHIAAGGS